MQIELYNKIINYFKKDKKIISFIPKNDLVENVMDCPKPAINFIPDWYKEINPYRKDPFYQRFPTKMHNSTVKVCMPFFDTMTAGYMITLPCDLTFVDKNKYPHKVYWDTNFVPVGEHPLEQVNGLTFPNNYNIILKWLFYFVIKTPPGYSCYFSHPKYRFDLPFLTLDGIVDTDNHPLLINFPFLMNDNFEGVLKKGTPIVQIFPFKREKWKSLLLNQKNNYDFEYEKYLTYSSKFYKNNFWKRKKYE